MKKTLIFLIAIVTFMPPLAIGKTLEKADLLRAGGRVVKGIVTRAGGFSFSIKTEDGKNLHLDTDHKTICFIPKDERLVVGDVISVVYFSPENASRSVDKNHAIMVEFISKVGRNFLKGNITCFLSFDYKTGISCVAKETGQHISVEGRFEYDPYTPLGTPINIDVWAVPATIGNGYVYKGRPIEDD